MNGFAPWGVGKRCIAEIGRSTIRTRECRNVAGARIKRVPFKIEVSGTGPERVDKLLRLSSLPPAVQQHRFHHTRKWCFDWAWPEYFMALEYEGGTFSKGAHVRGRHYSSDCIKYNVAASIGWAVFRVTRDILDEHPEHIIDVLSTHLAFKDPSWHTSPL